MVNVYSNGWTNWTDYFIYQTSPAEERKASSIFRGQSCYQLPSCVWIVIWDFSFFYGLFWWRKIPRVALLAGREQLAERCIIFIGFGTRYHCCHLTAILGELCQAKRFSWMVSLSRWSLCLICESVISPNCGLVLPKALISCILLQQICLIAMKSTGSFACGGWALLSE